MKKLLLILSGTLLTSTGCGLDDYERRMDVERKRVRIFDNEEANLGGFLDAPPPRKMKIKNQEEDVPAWPFEVYLRVPIGFERSPQSTDKKQYKLGDLFLYRYLCNVDKPPPDKPNETIKPGWCMLVGCSKVGEMNKSTGTFNANELSPYEFQRRILKVLREYYRAEYKDLSRDYDFAQRSPTKEMLQPEFVQERLKEPTPPPALEFETLEYTAPAEPKEVTAFQVYFHRNGANQIAIIFQMPQAMTKDPKFVRSRDFSLKSLDITENALLKKTEFVRTHKATPKKT